LDSWVFENYPAVENKEEAKNIEMGQSQQTRDEFDGREIRPIDALNEIKHPMQNWVRLSRGGWWSLRVAGDATRQGVVTLERLLNGCTGTRRKVKDPVPAFEMVCLMRRSVRRLNNWQLFCDIIEN
jgi:hypothetical protein